MKTAVEFISKGLFDILQEAENNNILEIGTQNFKRYIEMFEEQAKAMEKENIIDFGYRCIGEVDSELGDLIYKKIPEEIYNETFKSE